MVGKITGRLSVIVLFLLSANLPPPVTKEQLGARLLQQERIEKMKVEYSRIQLFYCRIIPFKLLSALGNGIKQC